MFLANEYTRDVDDRADKPQSDMGRIGQAAGINEKKSINP
jgi:hypothetical protein